MEALLTSTTFMLTPGTHLGRYTLRERLGRFVLETKAISAEALCGTARAPSEPGEERLRDRTAAALGDA